MISVTEALSLVLANSAPLPARRLGLAQCDHAVLREEVLAPHDSPPFDNTAMDGFAVRSGDIETASADSPVTLPIQGDVNAGGGSPPTLLPGRALRINTGAPLPEGADAVVRVEDAEVRDGEAVFRATVSVGTAVRRAGEDYTTGTVMLRSGRRLTPPALGLLASLGVANPFVSRPPRVALLATGDELVEPGNPLASGQIYNSTRHALMPMLRSWGAEVFDLGTVADDREKTRSALERGLAYDVLITTGGVSMGSRDLVRPVLSELGAREIFWKVAQRPGKPLYFAAHGPGPSGGKSRVTLCFGLPGNPVSVFVTALVYVRSALLAMQGAIDPEPVWLTAVAGEAFAAPPGLTTFVRAEIIPNGGTESSGAPDALPRLRPHRGQGSHQFSALSQADGLVRIEPDSKIGPGDRIAFHPFAPLP